MPAIRHSNDPCPQFGMFGHPCSSEFHHLDVSGAIGGHHHQTPPQLLPSVYQAALTHAGPYGHGRTSSHTPWEAVTLVAVSAIVLVAYIAVLGYLATRALRQVPRGGTSSNHMPTPGGLLDTRIIYNSKKGTCQPPLPVEFIDSPDGSFDV